MLREVAAGPPGGICVDSFFDSTILLVSYLVSTLWRIDPLLGTVFETDNEYSHCYAIGG
jgi:hypothetical protein